MILGTQYCLLSDIELCFKISSMVSPDLVVRGPRPIAKGIDTFECIDPKTSEGVLHVVRNSLPDNTSVGISWDPNRNLDPTLGAINQVWAEQKAKLYIYPEEAEDVFEFEFECPLSREELFQFHPKGIRWLRVESEGQQPALFAPFSTVSESAGITTANLALDWNHFLPLYRGTAQTPYGEAAVRRALVTTGLMIT
jgi:hypothetical protein